VLLPSIDVLSPSSLDNLNSPSPRTKLKRKNKSLQVQANKWKRKCLFAENKLTWQEKLDEIFSKTPTLLQIIKSHITRFEKARACHYTDEEKTIAFTIFYTCGRNGYLNLKNMGMLLPSVSTIRRWIGKLKVSPGINEGLFKCLASVMSTMNSFEKDAVLMIDEMHIKKCLLYNRQKDQLQGITDHGRNRRDLKMATQASVFMIRGLNTSWYFPICFGFAESNTTTADLQLTMFEIIDKLHSIGIKIRVIVTDMGFNNQALAKWLGVTIENPFFYRDGKIIYFVFDSPHLIKLVRNHFRKTGFNIKEKKIRWYHVQRLYDLDTKDKGARLAPKIGKYHIDLSDLTKQKVKLATQIFSRTVSAALHTLVATKQVRHTFLDTAEFIEQMDTLFDTLNISCKEDFVKPWKSAENVKGILNTLYDMETWVSCWKIPGDQPLPDCVGGLRQTLNGVAMLITDLKEEGYGYVFTRRIQQDTLENYFSAIRLGCGNHQNPTTEEFSHNFKILFLTQLLKKPNNKNCEDGETVELLVRNRQKLESILKEISLGKDKDDSCDSTSEPSSDDQNEDSGTSDSNEEDRYDNSYYDMFNLQDTPDNVTKSNNVSTYMGGFFVKSVMSKVKCKLQCPELLCFGHTSESSLYQQFKAYGKLKNSTLSYNHTLTAETTSVFTELGNIFKNCLLHSLNEDGQHVMANSFRRVKQNHVIGEWIRSGLNECKQHRVRMIKGYMRARLYNIVKTFNQQKPVKTPDQTREEMRHY